MTKTENASYTIFLSSRTFLTHLAWMGIAIVISIASVALMYPSVIVIDITIIPELICLIGLLAGILLFLLNGVLFVLSFIYWFTHRLVITETDVTLYSFKGKMVFTRSALKSVRMRQESGRDIKHNRGTLSFRSDAVVQDFGLIDDELRVITILRKYIRDPTFAAVTELQRRHA